MLSLQIGDFLFRSFSVCTGHVLVCGRRVRLHLLEIDALSVIFKVEGLTLGNQWL